jgi:hypothetical protein
VVEAFSVHDGPVAGVWMAVFWLSASLTRGIESSSGYGGSMTEVRMEAWEKTCRGRASNTCLYWSSNSGGGECG